MLHPMSGLIYEPGGSACLSGAGDRGMLSNTPSCLSVSGETDSVCLKMNHVSLRGIQRLAG